MKLIMNVLPAIICIAVFGEAQTIPSQNDPILGTWKGTSICQVKNSSCNDEAVVCHISKGAAPNAYRFVMNKIINNAEVSMGELDFIYNNRKIRLPAIRLPAIRAIGNLM